MRFCEAWIYCWISVNFTLPEATYGARIDNVPSHINCFTQPTTPSARLPITQTRYNKSNYPGTTNYANTCTRHFVLYLDVGTGCKIKVIEPTVGLWNNNNPLKTQWKYFSIQCYWISEKSLLLGGFPGFARLSFWQQLRADENDCHCA